MHEPDTEQPDGASSTAHRVRSVLAIPAFRRLWGVTAICAVGDWLSLLALSALATQLTDGYQAQSFALGGVVATKLLPAMLLGPLAGALADKLDRRHVMVVCDILRAGLFLSIPLVGELAWLFIATFLIELCAMFWIPAKDASIPNLLRRPDQVETANQLGLIMTYGFAVLVASGIFATLSKAGPALGQVDLVPSAENSAYFALAVNGLGYAVCALVVALRIPEISGRSPARQVAQPGLPTMLRDGIAFVRDTPLVRGLVIGIIGAFTAGGAVIACAKLYATSLGGGDAAYGLLFASMFAGLGLGMALAPQASRRIRHRRLFGLAIVAAGLALIPVALAPHLFLALGAVALVGAAAGVAFLTGLTIIGSQVPDEMRGRTIAFVQSIVRVVLLGSLAVVPLAVGLLGQRTVTVGGDEALVDGTRPVLFVAGVIAALVGLAAHRQMNGRGVDTLLGDLRAVLRRGRAARTGGGLLVAVEGVTRAETAAHAEAVAERLRADGLSVVLAGDPADEETVVRQVVDGAGLTAARARALAAAAVRADLVERQVRPALDGGAIVVMHQYIDGPLAAGGAAGELTRAELAGIAESATGRLAADLTVLLDRDPAQRPGPAHWGEQHWHVQRILTEMAATDRGRYLVVDADGEPTVVAEQVRAAVARRLRRSRAGARTTEPAAESAAEAP